jgi:biotin transport system substrate-specific component
MNSKDLVLTALMAAVISVLAPLAIPLGSGIPISLATFAVMLAGAILGEKYGTLSTLIYLILGSIGIPVFANYAAGFQCVIGITGGYLVGYLPLAWFTGYFYRKDPTLKGLVLGMVIGTFVLYLFGTIWFCIFAKMEFMAALGVCVIPFLPGDIIKMVAVALITPTLKKAIANRAGV